MFLLIGWLVGWLFKKITIRSHVVHAGFDLLMRMTLIFRCSISQVLGLKMCATMPSSAGDQTQGFIHAR